MSSFYFKVLNEGYVQEGEYTIKLSYKPGVHHVQGLGQKAGTITPKPYPEVFSREYNTFSVVADPETVNPETLYDRAAYNTFESPYISEIKIPKFKPVTFLYMYDTNGVRPSRTLVEFEGSEAALRAKYPDLANGKLYSQPEFYEVFGDAGFNRFGKVLPKGIRASVVNELQVVGGLAVDSGDIVDGSNVPGTAGTPTNINLYVGHLWMHNMYPTFSEFYIQGEPEWLVSEDYDTDKALLAPRMMRWLAGSNEGNRSFINFQDHSKGVDFASRFGSNVYGTARVDINPSEPETGEQLRNAAAYNVSNTVK